MNHLKIELLVSIALGCAFVCGTANAQSAAGQSAGPSQSAGVAEVGTVVVTAQKRVEKLEQVPIAISAYSSKERDLKGIETIEDLAKFTPGMSYGGPNSAVSIRGVGRVTNAFGVDNGVAEYYNGVYESDSSFVGLPTFFTDQTEILRGPQGTLYGRNSIGGAINIVTHKPTDTFQGELWQTFGNYDTSLTGLRVSGPITDKLDFLVAGYYDYQGQGYVHNIGGKDLGTDSTPDLEAQLDYRPNDKFDVWLTYDVSFLNFREPVGVSSSPYITTNPTYNGLVLNPLFGYTTPNPGVTNLWKQNIGYAGFARESIPTQEATVHVDWDLGPATLKYIGGFTRYNVQVSEDIDYSSRKPFVMPYTGVCITGVYCPYPNGITVSPTNVVNVDEDTTDWSNELDLTSNGAGPLKWIAGLYMFGEDAVGGTQLANPGQTELLQPYTFGGAPVASNPAGAYLTSDVAVRTHSYAAFAQVDYNITDQLTLTGGVRYTLDEKNGSEFENLIYFNPNATSSNHSFDLITGNPGFPGGGMGREDTGRWSGLSGKLDAEYRPNPNTNLFFTYSRGYKSGAFGLGDFDQVPDVGPEFVDDFEGGWKQVIGRTWQLNSDVFYYNYTNMQVVSSYQPIPGGPSLSSLRSVPKARSYGFEEEAIWSPIQPLQITLSYSYLNAKIVEFNNQVDPNSLNTNGQNLAGQDLPLSPRDKVALNILYKWAFEPGSLTVSGTYSWVDKSYAALFDSPLTVMPGYSDVDARLTWAAASKRYQLIAFAANLFNVTSISSVSSSNAYRPIPGFTGARLLTLNPPRTFGVQLKYFFGQ
jgi:iron complex outermembrane receptor protein